jgi:hypothetical protein
MKITIRISHLVNRKSDKKKPIRVPDEDEKSVITIPEPYNEPDTKNPEVSEIGDDRARNQTRSVISSKKEKVSEKNPFNVSNKNSSVKPDEQQKSKSKHSVSHASSKRSKRQSKKESSIRSKQLKRSNKFESSSEKISEAPAFKSNQIEMRNMDLSEKEPSKNYIGSEKEESKKSR